MKLRNSLFGLLIIVCLIGIGYAASGLIQAYKVYYTEDRQYQALVDKKNELEGKEMEEEKDALTEKMKEINQDYVAWIDIKGTTINYPIVRDKKNYLKINFEGKESICGTLFVSAAQNPFKDYNTVIFGHNMKDGSMFGTLKKYLDQKWFKEHQHIEIQFDGQNIIYEVFSVQIIDEDDAMPYTCIFDTEDIYGAFLQEAKKRSVIDDDNCLNKLPVITLSTCHGKGKRLIIVAQAGR